MLSIPLDDIRFCLDIANQLCEQYKLYILHSDAYPRSIDDLHRVAQTYVQREIPMFDLEEDWTPDKVRGFTIRTNGVHRIYIYRKQRACWERFTKAKEIFQVVLDKERFRSTDLYDLGRTVILHGSQDSAGFDIGIPLISETIAEIAAMQFLFPYPVRAHERKKIADGATYYSVADYYKTPELFVGKYLVDKVMTLLGAFEPTLR